MWSIWRWGRVGKKMCGGMIKLRRALKYILMANILFHSNVALTAEAENWICGLEETMSIHSYYSDGSSVEKSKKGLAKQKGQLTIGQDNKVVFKTKLFTSDLKLYDFYQGDRYTTFSGISQNPYPPNNEMGYVYRFKGNHEKGSANLRVIFGFFQPQITNLSFWACDKL